MASIKTHHLIVYATAGAIALVLGLYAGGLRDNGERQTTAIALQGGTAVGHMHRPMPEFQLTDSSGAAFDRERLLGKWSFFFFGYTNCPDICPMTLAMLANTVEQIDQQNGTGGRAPYQVVFVSVDPQRDKLERLGSYVSYFNPEFVGVTGEPEAIDSLTSQLGILHANVPDPNNPDNYLVDHSASILLVNPAGELEAVLSAPHSADVIASDFQTLVQHYEQG
jgi:protein SCO1/2